MFCTELSVKERCEGCPLTQREAQVQRRPLEPHELYRVGVQARRLLDQVSEIDVSNPDEARKALVQAESHMEFQESEPAFHNLDPLIRDITNWRMVGACDYHEGVIIQDVGLEERMAAFAANIMNQGEN